MKSESIAYYAIRILQRFTLLTTVGLTIIYWIVLINITISLELIRNAGFQQDGKPTFTNPEAVNETINRTLDVLSLGVGRWAVIGGIITLLMLLIPRVRKFNKHVVLDSSVVVIFCITSVIISQLTVRTFVTRYLAF